MSFLGSFIGSLAGRAAVPVVAAAGFGAYKGGAFDSLPLPIPGAGPSHFEMEARITGVERVCRLTFRQEGKLRRTQPMPCAQAVETLRDPVFRNYQLSVTREVTYVYYQPDGAGTFTGRLAVSEGGEARAYRINQIIPIRVDAKNPRDSEVI